MKLGDIVFFTAVMEAHSEKVDAMWSRRTVELRSKEVPRQMGILVGIRNGPVGTVHYSEDGPEFKRTGTVKYYLVVTNLYQNPIKTDPTKTHV